MVWLCSFSCVYLFFVFPLLLFDFCTLYLFFIFVCTIWYKSWALDWTHDFILGICYHKKVSQTILRIFKILSFEIIFSWVSSARFVFSCAVWGKIWDLVLIGVLLKDPPFLTLIFEEIRSGFLNFELLNWNWGFNVIGVCSPYQEGLGFQILWH